MRLVDRPTKKRVPLTDEQRLEVAKRIDLVDRLVAFYLLARPWLRMAQEDMIQEGVLGVINAIQTHDPSRGELGANCGMAIMNRIRTYAWHDRLIHLPNKMKALKYLPGK